MKKGFIVVLVALLALGGSAMAQKNIKLGHINSNDLMQIMPGRDTAMALLQKEVEDLQAEMEAMKKEYETQVNNYLAKKDQLSELIRKSKESDIQKMAERIETFQTNAQKLLEDRQEELLKPIVDRAKAAIEEVGKENGYTYIFDAGVGTLLYSQDSDDIMPLVKKKLGLK
ncbi:MAG: OmpH family outer membrane protein [Bacteroidales bacterium]|jgi:outer membrane protein|nr:OmpH family outer membrane protein [Bacteroidales bacterium]MBR3489358.1 OmpH family outer membrane protein [Bacteroidales bacterium]MBR6991095.1 OmpH family outer membrane protein [Bacteroidales bacterium]